jgi:hypothetical protein
MPYVAYPSVFSAQKNSSKRNWKTPMKKQNTKTLVVYHDERESLSAKRNVM